MVISRVRGIVLALVVLVFVSCAPSSSTSVSTAVPTGLAPTQALTAAIPTQPALGPSTAESGGISKSPLATESASAPTAPTAEPAPSTETPTSVTRTLVLEEPQSGATISSPVRVRGSVSITPFESTLRGRVYDARGQVVGETPIMLPTEMGQPGTFDGEIPFSAGTGGSGRVEVAELSPRDGSVLVSATAEVVLTAGSGASRIEIPEQGAQVTLPLHIMARTGQPGERVVVVLRWRDGTELTQIFTLLRGEDGRGLLLDSLNWPGESQPPDPATQLATLELRDGAGAALGRQDVTVLNPSDPDTKQITLYYLLGESVQAVTQPVPSTAKIGTAALEELLWGPPPPNLAGFGTALPTPRQVLDYPGRELDWGPRVTLRKLVIVDGVATADFSQEMKAYGGGSLRVKLIRDQITQTLKQFSTVAEVVIAIEGETEGVLEP